MLLTTYEESLNRKSQVNSTEDNENANSDWKKLKTNIRDAAYFLDT